MGQTTPSASVNSGASFTPPADVSRRRFLTYATAGAGAVGGAAAAWPFLAYWAPSERAKAAGAAIDVDISKLEAGAVMSGGFWRGKPIKVLRRTPEQLAGLKAIEGKLRDAASAESDQPKYTQNEARSIKPEYLVFVSSCTHLGCAPAYQPEVEGGKGGFFCACHGSTYDLAGRVYKGVPAPKNLEIPPHRYAKDTVMRVGEDPVA